MFHLLYNIIAKRWKRFYERGPTFLGVKMNIENAELYYVDINYLKQLHKTDYKVSVKYNKLRNTVSMNI